MPDERSRPVAYRLIPSDAPVLKGLGRYQGPCMERAFESVLRAAEEITANATFVTPEQAAELRAWYGPAGRREVPDGR